MANFKLMPDVVDLREVTFTNILILGFDVETNEAQYRIPFTRDMFAVPNRKGMEVILHFLFVKLNSDSAKESFRNCWPIVDRKKEQEFRKICIEWITKIKKDDSESLLPTIVPSLLLSPTGDRFYQFLFYFSTYVMKQKVSHFPAKYGQLPSWAKISSVNRKYLPQILKSLTVSATNKKSRLIAFMELVTHTKHEWVKFAREQSKEHRKLCKIKRECEREIKDLRSIQEQIFGKGSRNISSKEALKRTQSLQKVTEFWKMISNLFEAEKCLQEQIDELLSKDSNKRELDGCDINFKVPDILLRECERQLDSGKRYQNLYEGGKVNLLSLVQLWNLSLHLIKESLSQFPLPNMEHDEAYIRAEAHNHANGLNSYASLSNSLSKRLLPDLKLSVDELKENSSNIVQINKFGLDFIPATPPVNFEAENDGSSRMMNVNQTSHEQQYMDTPDAVDVLLHRIRKDASRIDDDQDDTPVRGVPRTKVTSTSKKSKPSKAFVKETFTATERKNDTRVHSKIPIPKTSKPAKLSFKTPVRTHEADKMYDTTKTNESTKKEMLLKSSKKESNDERQKFIALKAQELLIDQIAQSVLNVNDVMNDTKSDSDEYEENDTRIHALDDPMEAFTTVAFHSRDMVPRTPASKKTRGNIDTTQPPTYQQFDGFDLKALQDRIDEIKFRDQKSPATHDIDTELNLTPLRLNGTQSMSNDAGFISPLHDLSSITPLREPDIDTTPVVLTPSDDLNIDFGTSSSKRIKASENAERHSETSYEPKEMLQFTPLPVSVKGSISSEGKSKLDLFLQNNRDIFTPNSTETPNWSHSIDNTTRSNRSTNFSVTKTPENLINFLTPFKDPFSPSAQNEHEGDTTTTPVNMLNVSAQDVDDFIEEVISNTSKTPTGFASATKTKYDMMKTPAIFGIHKPTFSNDYSLMTPGIDQTQPFRLNFSDDDYDVEF